MSKNYCGLINNGNFCYFISAIQNLKFSKSIIKNITDEDENKEELELLKLIKNSDKEFLEKNQVFIKKAILFLNFKKLIINMCSSNDEQPIDILQSTAMIVPEVISMGDTAATLRQSLDSIEAATSSLRYTI